jgi:hypothetical protein
VRAAGGTGRGPVDPRREDAPCVGRASSDQPSAVSLQRSAVSPRASSIDRRPSALSRGASASGRSTGRAGLSLWDPFAAGFGVRGSGLRVQGTLGRGTLGRDSDLGPRPRRIPILHSALSAWLPAALLLAAAVPPAPAQDCNNNGIPDACDLSCGIPGGPCDLPGCGQSQDCNSNGIPDECDIASGTSEDCVDAAGQSGAPDGIPDECQPAPTGLIYSRWDDAAGFWNVPENWCPQLVPNNGGGDTYSVTIANPTSVVTLDISPILAALAIQNRATVQVNQNSGASVLSLAADTAVANAGFIRAWDGNWLLFDACDIVQDPNGVIEALGSNNEDSRVQISGHRVVGGTVHAFGRNARIELLGADPNNPAVLDGVNVKYNLVNDQLLETVRVPAGQYARLAGTITSTGMIGVATDANDPTVLFVDEAGATLQGAGWLRLGNPNSNVVFNVGGSFVNDVGHTIAGTATIGFSAPFANRGTIVANEPNMPLLIWNTAVPPVPLKNKGLLSAVAGGVLELDCAVTGNGRLEANEARLVLFVPDGASTELDGTGTVRNGGILDAEGSASSSFTCGDLSVLNNRDPDESGLGTAAIFGGLRASVAGGTLVDGVTPCARERGCTPPILKLISSAAFATQSLQGSRGGVIQLYGTSTVDVGGGITLDTGAVLEGGDPNSAAIIGAAAALVTGDGTSDGAQVLLSGAMSATVAGATSIDGVTTCPPGRGCTPPILKMTAQSAFDTGTLQVLHGGQMQFGDNAMTLVSSSLSIDTGGVVRGLDNSAAQLTAGSITISNGGAEGGQLLLDGTIDVHVTGDVTLEYTTGRAGDRGCTPPILKMEASPSLYIDGSLVLTGRPQIQVQGLTPRVTLAGNFVNHSTDPLTFDWSTGALTLDGTAQQAFEVAGTDLGPGPAGLIDNFALARLEVDPNANVWFADTFDNDPNAQGSCGEALYVDTLVLHSGAHVEVADCTVYCLHLVAEPGVVVTTIGCGRLVEAVPGDIDGDLDVDFDDFSAFAACMAGPDVTTPPARRAPGDFARADLDGDGDVDLADFAAFQALR